MGCLGNGITVSNKSVIESGDYKQIAHISEHGNIKLYVSADYIPPDEMKRIQTVAKTAKQKFLEQWNKKNFMHKWEYMMGIPTIGCGETAITLVNSNNKNLPMEQRVELMEQVFFDTHM